MEPQRENTTHISLEQRVLVVGDTPVARLVVKELTSLGHEVIWTSDTTMDIHGNPLAAADRIPSEYRDRLASSLDEDKVEVIAPAHVASFEGEPGHFVVEFVSQEQGIRRNVGGVVLATGTETGSPLEAWGPEPSERIWSLSSFAHAVESGVGIPPLEEVQKPTVVFVCGFTHHSHPLTQRTAFRWASRIAGEENTRVLFLVEHFKVADTGMERLSREARESGVLFVKMTGDRPQLRAEGNHILLSYPDETLGDRVTVRPDLVVLEEPVRPPESTSTLAAVLGVELDSGGFFQGDNVYNLPIFTNRTGIWVAGSAKGPVSLSQGLAEASAAAMEANKLLGEGREHAGASRIQLDPKRCAICLTCFRICPHRAISYVNRRPVFSCLACKACGMCEAECPMGAITLDGSEKSAPLVWNSESDTVSSVVSTEESLPVVAFCCENSALQAARFARMISPLPSNLEVRPVPCGANVDVEMLLEPFQRGAEMVMVLVCHHDSCKSVVGSHLAEWRMETLRESLEEMGISKERLVFTTMAPGMPRDFIRVAHQVAETHHGLAREGSSNKEAAGQEGDAHE